MNNDEDIRKVARGRELALRHAINLRDYKNYLHLGGVVCREDLIAKSENYTPFVTDDTDKNRGLLSRTFGNVYDMGQLFWNCPDKCFPCVYGPIMMVFNEDVWSILEDICFTKGTAGTLGNEEIKCMAPEEINECKKLILLEANFSNRVIPTDFLKEVIVDPIEINNKSLYSMVRKFTPESVYVKQRENVYATSEAFNMVLNKKEDKIREVEDARKKSISDKERYAYNNWIRYFKNGTLPFFC